MQTVTLDGEHLTIEDVVRQEVARIALASTPQHLESLQLGTIP